MIIKLLLIAGLCGAAVVALRGSSGAGTLALRRLAVLGFVAVGALSVVFPGITTWAAEQVGVAQGSNLVLYLLVIAFLFVTLAIYQRLHALESRLARLTRALALAESALEAERAPRPDRAASA